jgi:hypothetical protein
MILREMGHDVDFRKVTVGEELPYIYDYAFCGVSPLSSIVSGNVPETHYVMDTMTGRYSIFADDWSFYQYGSSVRRALDQWDKYLKYKKFPYMPNILEATKDSLELLISLCLTANAPTLCPLYPWGDHEIPMENNYNSEVVAYDPSPWVKFPPLPPKPLSERRKQWVMAALSDTSRWVNKQNFTLPIEYVGHKKLSNGRVLTQDQTVQLFSESYGVLSCGYPISGSGWWRVRFLDAAWVESLVYADPLDSAVMGEAFQHPLNELENLTDKEYVEIVNQQSDWLLRNTATKEAVFETFEKLMKK